MHEEDGYIVDDADGEPIFHPECPVPGHWRPVTQVEFSDGGTQLISASYDSTVRVWEVARARVVARLAGDMFALVEGPSADQVHSIYTKVDESCYPAESWLRYGLAPTILSE